MGHLGHAIARRLIDQGVPLVVWNRTRSKALDLGVPVVGTPKELADMADTVKRRNTVIIGDCGARRFSAVQKERDNQGPILFLLKINRYFQKYFKTFKKMAVDDPLPAPVNLYQSKFRSSVPAAVR